MNPWLPLSYLVPWPRLWEGFHREVNHWNYGAGHYVQLVEYLRGRPELESVLDLACNEGYFLESLGWPRMAGLDVSGQVLARACQRVPGLVAIRYDLCRFFEARPPRPPALLAGYDLCVVSDVLYYLAPFRLSPYLYWNLLPEHRDLARKQRFLKHCAGLARKLVVVGAHQEARGIRYLLEATPGFRRVLPGYFALELT